MVGYRLAPDETPADSFRNCKRAVVGVTIGSCLSGVARATSDRSKLLRSALASRLAKGETEGFERCSASALEAPIDPLAIGALSVPATVLVMGDSATTVDDGVDGDDPRGNGNTGALVKEPRA